jgi:hypothetical protein
VAEHNRRIESLPARLRDARIDVECCESDLMRAKIRLQSLLDEEAGHAEYLSKTTSGPGQG